MRVLAAIVLFNPDKERLSENIRAIVGQVKGIVFFNNGKEIPQDVFLPGDVLGESGKNVGIARALNEVCRYALAQDYDWVLTLDQDSVCPDGLVNEFRRYVNDENVGMICPRVLDRNMGALDGEGGEAACEIETCITSASMLRLSAWREVGGFWDDLFIDMVDIDMCWQLKEKGYKTLQVQSKALLHEIGHGKRVKLFGKDEVVYNHAPFRSYYMARNFVLVGKKHHRLYQCIRWCMRRFLLLNLYEDHRLSKDRQFLKGLIDGLSMSI